MANPTEYRPGEKVPETAERWAKALELRKAGKTFAEIAAECGYASVSGAYDAVMSALKAVLREPAEEVRTLEAERLDRLTLAVWGPATASPPDLDAFDRVLKLMDRRAKLLGLDAPSKVSVTTADLSDDELIARAADIVGGTRPAGGGGEAAVDAVPG